MSNVKLLWVGNDMILEVAELRNTATGAYLNAATVTATLTDAAGVNLGGQSWPLAMVYVTGSNGIYRATLTYALQITARERVTATIAVNAGGGLRAQWVLDCIAADRVD